MLIHIIKSILQDVQLCHHPVKLIGECTNCVCWAPIVAQLSSLFDRPPLELIVSGALGFCCCVYSPDERVFVGVEREEIGRSHPCPTPPPPVHLPPLTETPTPPGLGASLGW